MKLSLRQMALTALFAAVMCVLAPFTIPLPLVPVTLATFALYLAVTVLGFKSWLSVTLYVLIGLVGMPVFSGFAGGAAKLFGPTGGYIIGYIPCAVIAGFLIDRFRGKVWLYPVAMIAGTVVLYVFGTVWFLYVAGMHEKYTVMQAIFTCVTPFLAIDFCKMVVAAIVGDRIYALLKRLERKKAA